MRKVRILLFVPLLFILSSKSVAQYIYIQPASFNSDTVKENKLDVPTKTLIKSAIIPGWGQIANHQFYKVPIVWAGLGFAVYNVQYNYKKYNSFKQAYIMRIDDDPTTIDIYDPVNGSNSKRYNETQLVKIRDAYRRNMELSVLSTLGVYALNLIDAYVSAHLLDFDLDDDLSIKTGIIPNFVSDYRTIAYFGLTYKF